MLGGCRVENSGRRADAVEQLLFLASVWYAIHKISSQAQTKRYTAGINLLRLAVNGPARDLREDPGFRTAAVVAYVPLIHHGARSGDRSGPPATPVRSPPPPPPGQAP